MAKHGYESVACMTLSRVLLQLPVPEGFQPRYYHSLTAASLAQGITVVTAFGGYRKYFSDRIAETTLLQFGEYTCFVSVLKGPLCTEPKCTRLYK